MIYQLLLKRHIQEKNKTSNFQQQKNAVLVKGMVLKQDIHLKDVRIVGEVEE